MAALTQSAIDGLLGLLAKAITDEAKLIGGVPGNMQFIRDEMDSMNGFLLHLTKTEGEHDDQVRAWMKQVREIAYIAEDCVQRYLQLQDHGMAPHEADRCGGLLGALSSTAPLLVLHPGKYRQLHAIGKQIAELKVRVRDVGERRWRYGVEVPPGSDRKLAPIADQQEEDKREAFAHALELELQQDVVGSEQWWRAQHQAQAWLRSSLRRATAVGGLLPAVLPSAVLRYIPFSGRIIGMLPDPVRAEAATVHGILKKCAPGDDSGDKAAAEAFRCTKRMFLCALHAYPYATNQELGKLKEKLEGRRAQEPRKEVMIFCYSMLTTQQKSCLQYLTAFLHESEISRTSMVRRWVAEGLVGKEPGGGRTPEEEGECCFRELLFRGFIRAARFSDAGTVKSCVMEEPVRDFIQHITGSENFEVSLPAHLGRQVEIRRIVQQHQKLLQEQGRQEAADHHCWGSIARRCNNLCRAAAAASEEDAKDPMDVLVDFLRKLPELYRLNVLDLGGCRGIRRRHLRSFAHVVWIKYLSLRNTDVSRLQAHHINRLTMLETLDIRGTSIRPRDTKRINLPKLKHLLAGRYLTPGDKASSLVTVQMPRKIGFMRSMETLSHVQVSKDGTELREVTRLRKLRKLGVVVHGGAESTANLGRVLHALSGCLRSLSVCVTLTQGWALDDTSSTQEMMGAAPRPSFILENLDIKGKINGLPSWIAKAQKLVNVTLRGTELSGEDALRRLASVLSLRCLKLSSGAFTEQELSFKLVQFKALKTLVLEGGPITTVTFRAADEAPALQKIVWTIGRSSRVRDEYLIAGINNLPNLKAIEIRGDFKTTSLMEWAQGDAESTNNPRYRIRYMSSTASAGNELMTEVPKTAKHTTLSIPVAVINQH
jgi:hypothetical protein